MFIVTVVILDVCIYIYISLDTFSKNEELRFSGKAVKGCLTVEGGTDSLFRNVGSKIPLYTA